MRVHESHVGTGQSGPLAPRTEGRRGQSGPPIGKGEQTGELHLPQRRPEMACKPGGPGRKSK